MDAVNRRKPALLRLFAQIGQLLVDELAGVADARAA